MTQTKKTEYEEWAARQDPRSTPQNPYLSNDSIRAAPDKNFDITLGESLKRANMNLSDSAHGLTNALGQLAATETANYMKYKSNTPVKIEDSPILSLGQSLVQNLIPGKQGNEAMAQNLAKHYHDRYSSAQGFKQHFAEDPFPMLLDVAGTSALAKPITIGAINTTKAGIDATKAGISTVKSNVKFNAPDKMNPELVWHGGTLVDDVPINLTGGHKVPNSIYMERMQGGGLERHGIHASSHTTGPIETYAKKISKNRGIDAAPTLTEFNVKGAKPFFYNQPQKDVVKSVNSQIKTLEKELKNTKNNLDKAELKLLPFTRRYMETNPGRKKYLARQEVLRELSKGEGRTKRLQDRIHDLKSLRDGEVSMQGGITRVQMETLQDLGYQIIRPKHPTRDNFLDLGGSGKIPLSGPSGALNKNHVLIIDKNLPRRNVKDWEAAADRGRAQRETLGRQDMMNAEKSTTATFFETLFKK